MDSAEKSSVSTYSVSLGRAWWTDLVADVARRRGRKHPQQAERMFGALLRNTPGAALSAGVVLNARPTLYGWIPASTASDAKVRILLNGEPIAETIPNKVIHQEGGVTYVDFRRGLRDMWRYLGRNDRIAVEVDGRRLRFASGADDYRVRSWRRSRAEELRAKLAEGHIFTKVGGLVRPLAEHAEWRQKTLGAFDKARALVEEQFGYRLFPVFGVMLGAVREGDIIRHDHDLDIGYLSAYSERELVVGEFMEICRALRAGGFRVSLWGNCAKVHASDGAKLDLFYSWFAPDDTWRISFGHHGVPARKSPRFFSFREYKLGDYRVQLPEAAEEMLEQIYTADWRIPNPGFGHSKLTLKRERSHLMTIGERVWRRPPAAVREKLRWDRYYRTHSFSTESTFARFVAGMFPTPSRFVELGCGEGRDAVFFARQGHRVLAVDRAAAGIARAAGKTAQMGLTDIVFRVGDVANVSLGTLLDAERIGEATDRPLVVYMRFFLHSIPLESETAMFDVLGRHMPERHHIAIEFRTDADAHLAKAEGVHYRRFIAPADMRSRLERRGYTILHHEASTGLSVYRGEDPHLCRIIARHDAAPLGSASRGQD